MKVFPKKKSGKFAQAVMDFASEVCTKSSPSCQDCLLKKNCKSFKKGMTYSKKLNSKLVIKKFSIVQLYVLNKKYFFLKKRPINQILGGLYEVPGSEWKLDVWPDFSKNLKGKYLIPDIINYKFSHFELKTRVIIINLKVKSFKKKNGIWVSQEGLNKIPISNLTKKIIAHSLK